MGGCGGSPSTRNGGWRCGRSSYATFHHSVSRWGHSAVYKRIFRTRAASRAANPAPWLPMEVESRHQIVRPCLLACRAHLKPKTPCEARRSGEKKLSSVGSAHSETDLEALGSQDIPEICEAFLESVRPCPRRVGLPPSPWHAGGVIGHRGRFCGPERIQRGTAVASQVDRHQHVRSIDKHCTVVS